MINVIKRFVAAAIAVCVSLSSLCASVIDKYYNLPTYTVGDFKYAINNTIQEDKDYPLYKHAGAVLVPNDNAAVKYSGKITIPDKVTIEGVEYPVYGFMWLSEYADNESGDLEITLPESIKVIGSHGSFVGGYSTIKSINMPTAVECIGAMRYHVDGATVTLPGSIEYIGYEAGVYAENLVIEDGVRQFSRYSTSCDNIVLTLPGTVWLNEASLDASKLEVLNIKKSANADAVPHFDYYCLCHSYNVKAIICEYDIVPPAEKDAFGFESYGDVDHPGMYDRTTLYVPKAAIDAYKADAEWGRFEKILAIEDNVDIIKKLEGVDDISADAAEVVATEYYDLSGRRLEAPADRGITITATIYSDGTRRCAKTIR